MAEEARKMMRKRLEALIEMNTKIASNVLTLDYEIDDLNREMYSTVQVITNENPESIDRAVNILSVSRYLKRIADLSANIAVDVVYLWWRVI
jgi:phosphate transport system protein